MEGDKLLEYFKLELARTEREREICRELKCNTTKLKNKAKTYRKIVENLERNVDAINSLKTHTYYSIKVAYRSSNVEHSAIMYVGFNIRDIVIFNPTYETMSERYCIEEIYKFEVLRELIEMKNI